MEVISADLKDLPPTVTALLHKLRDLDRLAKTELDTIKKEEEELLQQVIAVTKSGNKDFDEAPYQEKLKELLARRQNITRRLETQMNLSQHIYNLVDSKISYLDSHMKDIQYLFPYADEVGDSKKKKKKKKEKAEDEDEEMDQELQVDPNEPVYCVCRRVSFGNMIACENPDCLIEWFHFPCVNLTSEPKDPWYCPDCAPMVQGKNK